MSKSSGRRTRRVFSADFSRPRLLWPHFVRTRPLQNCTSKRNPKHKVFPYLLRKLVINRGNQMWALDTTYIRMARGFVYLTAVVDVYSWRILAHRTAITLEAVHAVEAVVDNGVKMSMDGRGAWRDNVVVERVWRLSLLSLKEAAKMKFPVCPERTTSSFVRGLLTDHDRR